MSYQVLARKWRPQQFDDVIGQPAVTRTLAQRHHERPHRAVVRVCGPARRRQDDDGAHSGARAELREGADGRIRAARATRAARLPKAATSTSSRSTPPRTPQVDNVREVIIDGLSIMPVRNRYKVFIIDEVHQLSTHSFNALLKSIEEPPPHVIFMMATTELVEDSRDGAVALAGVRVQDDLEQADRRSASEDRRRREDRGRRCGAAADRAGGRRQHARRAERVRSGHRVRRAEDYGRRRGDGAGAGRARSRARHRHRRGRRDAGRRVRAVRARGRAWLRPAARSSASCRASCAICSCCRSIRRASTIPRSRRRASAIG